MNHHDQFVLSRCRGYHFFYIGLTPGDSVSNLRTTSMSHLPKTFYSMNSSLHAVNKFEKVSNGLPGLNISIDK